MAPARMPDRRRRTAVTLDALRHPGDLERIVRLGVGRGFRHHGGAHWSQLGITDVDHPNVMEALAAIVLEKRQALGVRRPGRPTRRGADEAGQRVQPRRGSSWAAAETAATGRTDGAKVPHASVATTSTRSLPPMAARPARRVTRLVRSAASPDRRRLE